MKQIYPTQASKWLYNDTVRWHHLATERAKKRLLIISFWEKHGAEATADAFGVSRRTLFRWKAKLRQARGHVDGLNERSTAPKRRRRREYPPGFLEKAIGIRRSHERTGKKKLAAMLGVSKSYAGRCLNDLKKRGLLPHHYKISLWARSGKVHALTPTKRPRIRRKEKRGVEADTVIRFVDGIKRYVYTAIDVERKFAFAAAYTNHSSASAADFLRKLRRVAPFGIEELQTDNGSEFAALFEDACREAGITHFHTYPRSPKMNAHVERFNRTLSEDFIALNRRLLSTDLARFNEALIDWLLWYNTERPHESLGMLSPLRYIVRNLTERECQMYWTRTTP